MKRKSFFLLLCAATASAFAANELRVSIPRLAVSAPTSPTPEEPVPPLTASASLTPQSGASFGLVEQGDSATLSFVFANTGQAVLSEVYAQLAGAGLSLSSNTCGTAGTPVSLQVGASCKVAVTYSPSTHGALSGAALSVLSSATGSPHTQALSGSAPVQLQNFGTYRGWQDGTFPTSCKGYRTPTGNYRYAGATGDGVYRTDPDGPGGQDPQLSYCDMTSDGGGWTRVVVQYEATPLTMWETAGINGGSQVLRQHLMPPHTQVGFGQGNQATTVDYVNWVYTTGDIPLTVVTSPKTGKQYHVHRNSNTYYNRHDPEVGPPTSYNVRWNNTLTFDELGKEGYNWAFSPHAGTAAEPGYAFGGVRTHTTVEGYAWTVWVR